MRQNKSIIYWKWEDSTLQSDLIEKIEDLCKRTQMTAVFIALHWVKKSIADKDLLEAVAFCADELHKRGRKLYLELCPRNEGNTFFEQYPMQTAFLTNATEISLDENGKGEARIDVTAFPHYWRENRFTTETLLNGFIFDKVADFTYAPDGVIDAAQFITLSDVLIDEKQKRSVNVCVSAGIGNKNKTAVAFVGIPQPIPELASDRFEDFFGAMLDHFKEIKIDGVCSDEWGYDVILNIDEGDDNPDFYRKKEIYLNHISYSQNFARRYSEECGGNLERDILDLFYHEAGNVQKSIAKVNNYHKTLRSIMRVNDEQMYGLTKERFGVDTFFGVHPTWWGNNYLQNFEGFKNGFYWWEAKRDIAQTDEIVIMPIRTALAHKCQSSIWYNMWYSMGTRDINTYYRETWQNIRFGGRTHYLAYECPNESVVLELKQDGMLESIEEMDAIVRSIDPIQTTQPDCRVLILFGLQNCLNWFFNDNPAPPWYPRHRVQYDVLQCAEKVFEQFLCDLVPTTEIENGSLTFKENKVVYGTQTYDTVVLLAPDSMDKSCFSFLSRLDKADLIVCGNASIYSDGTTLSQEHIDQLNGFEHHNDILCPEDIVAALQKKKIKANRFSNGCVLQDGSLVFTGDGKKPSHNELIVDVCHNGIDISFTGEDLLYLQKDNGQYLPTYPKGTLSMKEK